MRWWLLALLLALGCAWATPWSTIVLVEGEVIQSEVVDEGEGDGEDRARLTEVQVRGPVTLLKAASEHYRRAQEKAVEAMGKAVEAIFGGMFRED